MQFLKNGILLIIFYGVASCKPHKMNYLDMEWVNHAKNRVVNAKTAKKLLNAGIKQFSSKNYKKAKISFEQSLRHQVIPETYYYYGRTLAQMGSFQNAVKAYEISAALNYKKKYLAYYNIACLYSIQNKKQESLRYIDKALKAGYYAIAWILKDPDLKNLRSDHMSHSRLYRILLKNIGAKKLLQVIDRISSRGRHPREHWIWTSSGGCGFVCSWDIYCPNGVLLEVANPPDHYCCKSYRIGRWWVSNGMLYSISGLKICGSEGINKISNDENPGPQYESFRVKKCEYADSPETIFVSYGEYSPPVSMAGTEVEPLTPPYPAQCLKSFVPTYYDDLSPGIIH